MAHGTSAPKTWTWYDGEWLEGNPPLIGPRSHAFWLGTSVFDGARAFEGVTPDLDRHCARVNRSALAVGLEPTMRDEEVLELAREGLKYFDRDAALYIRPSYWGEHDHPNLVIGADPASTRFAMTLWEAPMSAPTGISVTLSRFRRPTIECMPTDAKAGCLYPNNARAAREARAKGFDNAMVLDMLGNVAELASANVFMVKDGVALTPAANGTYLAGITRSRVIELLRASGTPVVEKSLRYEDFLDADEMFSTGNYTKVLPIVRFEDRALEPGPVYRLARRLYWEFAHG
ncbi:MAG: branched-chain amino acid aminotransferase [Hyphomicrobiales bacterium]|nr:branched-chain amino acid aminotransferase [Hyphomicrobiales bacterium]